MTRRTNNRKPRRTRRQRNAKRQYLGERLEDRRLLAADLQLAADINIGASSSGIADLTLVGDNLFFTADDGTGNSIWQHTPATGTTEQLLDPGTLQPLTGFDLRAFQGQLVFGGAIGSEGLYSYDPGTHSLSQLSTIYSAEATVVGDSVFFRADDGNVGEELWRYDAGGTVSLVSDLDSSPTSSNLDRLIPGDDELYFWAQYNTTDATTGVNNLYQVDVTTGVVTHVFTADYLFDGFPPLNMVEDSAVAGGQIYYPYVDINSSSPAHNNELGFGVSNTININDFDVELDNLGYANDGSLGYSSSDPFDLVTLGGKLFFTASRNVAIFEGTDINGDIVPVDSGGFPLDPDHPFSIQDYYIAGSYEYRGIVELDPSNNTYQFVVGDLTSPLDTPVFDIGYGSGSLLAAGNRLLFTDGNAYGNGGLWSYDPATGTSERLIEDTQISTKIDLSNGQAIPFGGAIYLTYDDAATGRELFVLSEASPPVANAGGPYTGTEGEDITFDGTGSTDAETPTASLLYEWDLDFDGSSFQVDATGAQPSVNFEDDFATRDIALRVTDPGGLSDLAVTTLDVQNARPVILSLPDATGQARQAVTFSVTASDPGINDTLTYSWDFGQGDPQSGVNLVAPTHTYPASGTYNGTLTVTDDAGESVQGSFAVVIAEPVSFSVASQTVDESVGQVTATISLASPATSPITIPYTLSGTANGDDHDLGDSVVTLEVGQTSVGVTLQINDDVLDEVDVETIVISLGTPTGASLGSIISHEILVTDNDAQPTAFLSTPFVLLEEDFGATTTITVQLDRVSGREVVVPLGFAGSATIGSDFTVSDSAVMIPAGAQTAFATVSLINDTTPETAETIQVTLLDSDEAVLGMGGPQPKNKVITIPQNDQPQVWFDFASFNRFEGDSNSLEYGPRVVVSKSSTTEITIPFFVSGDTDQLTLSPPNGVLTIPPGQTSAAFQYGLIDDDVAESVKSITISLGTPTGAILGPTPATTIQIFDNDIPAASLTSSAPASLFESAGQIPFAIELDRAATQDITFKLRLSGSSGSRYATEGVDYELVDGPLTLPQGQTRIDRVINLIDDELHEGSEEIALTLEVPAGFQLDDVPYVRRGTDELRFTIRDNDPLIRLRAPETSVVEGDQTISYEVYLEGDTESPVAVSLALSGEAQLGSDYTHNSATAIALDASTRHTGTLTIRDDVVDELIEHVRLKFSSADADFASLPAGPLDTISITIQDNDAPPPLAWVRFGQASANENDGPIDLTIQLSSPAPEPLDFEIGASLGLNPLIAGGTGGYTFASADASFDAFTGQGTIPEGADQFLLTLVPPQDTAFTGAREIFAGLTSLSGLQLGTLEASRELSNSIRIWDDDPVIRLRAPSGTRIREDQGQLQFGASVQGTHSEPIAISYVVTGTATHGVDYTGPTSGTLTVQPGTQELVTLNVINDVVPESVESINVNFTSDFDFGTTTSGAPLDSLSLSIADDGDRAPKVSVELLDSDVAVEGSRRRLRIHLSHPSPTPVRAVVGVSTGFGLAGARPGGTSQYGFSLQGNTSSNGEYEIPPNQLYTDVDVNIADNSVRDGDRSIHVGVLSASTDSQPGPLQLELPSERILVRDNDVQASVPEENRTQAADIPPVGSLNTYVETLNNATSIDPPQGLLPSAGGADGVQQSSLSFPLNISNGFISGGTVFFDANFNGVADYLDTNANGLQDVGEPSEPKFTTDLEGNFIGSIDAGFDLSGDGLIDASEGRWTIYGGTDSSKDLPLLTPMSAPPGMYVINGVSTLAGKLIELRGHSLASAKARLADVFELSAADLGFLDNVRAASVNNQEGNQAVVANAQIMDSANLISRMYAALPGTPEVPYFSNIVFEQIATLISGAGSTIDLTSDSTQRSLIAAVENETGFTMSPVDADAAASVIAAGNTYIQEQLTDGDTSDLLESVVKAQIVAQTDVATALEQLAVGDTDTDAAAVTAAFTGPALETLIAGATPGIIIPPALVVRHTWVEEGNSGTTNMTFQVDIIGEPTLPVSVDYQTLDGSATVADGDYVATSGTLNWGVGETDSKTVVVAVAADTAAEFLEHLTLTLTNPTNSVVRADIAYGYIASNGFDSAFAVAENESAFFELPDSTLSLGSTFNVTEINGQPFTGVITLASGATIEPAAEPNRFIYDPHGAFDSLSTGETGNDSFTYTIADEGGQTATANVSITINGFDDPASVEIVVGDAFVQELSDSTSLVFQAELVGEAQSDVQFHYRTVDGTAVADEGDFVSKQGTVVWEAGDTSPKYITIEVLTDDRIELTESFTLELFHSAGATLQTSQVTGVIYDQEIGPTAETTDAASDGFEATLVKDINVRPLDVSAFGSSPANFVDVNGEVFFTAFTATTGTDLWKTDGTEEGTQIVRDILSSNVFFEPNAEGSTSPEHLTVVGGDVFFSFAATIQERGLWKSDGTKNGTVPLWNGFVHDMVELDGLVLFHGSKSFSSDRELWRSDGTPEGTVVVKDINPGSASATPSPLTPFGNAIYFWANDGTVGYELWKSDGTETGTSLVKDIVHGAIGSSAPGNQLIQVGDFLYFFSIVSGRTQLWKSDGTSDGTVMVTDIGSTSSTPIELTAVNNELFFLWDDGVTGRELWKSDGTAAGTNIVKDVAAGTASSTSTITELTVVGEQLYFTANDGIHGIELWTSDGTASGTVMVHDIRAGSASALPGSLTAFGDSVYFSAFTTGQPQLWKSDGTAAGTVPLGAFAPDEIANVGGALFFQAAEFENSIKQQLWTSDGTPEGTRLVKYIENSNGDSISRFQVSQEFVDIGGTTYFVAESSDFGQELWRSDGTESGTAMVRDIRPNQGSSSIRSLSNIDGTLYFIANDGTGFELWKSDGTEAGTTAVTNFVATNVGFGELVVLDDTLFFVVLDATSGSELWKSDGTTAGTTRVKDIYPGSTGSSPQHLTVVGDRVYFSARDNSFGFELWSSDGTSAGTVRVKDIATGSASSAPSNLIAVGNHLFFEAADATSGRELWFSDGSTSGTYRIQDLTPGTGSSNLTLMTSFGDSLYFTDRQNLWVSNGTAQGTSAILPFSNSQDQLLRWEEYNGQLYFLMNTGIFNYELWKSDGTTSGTIPIRTFTRPESGLDYELAQMQVIGENLYFSMFDSLNGLELWVTDGTAENTRLAQDLSIGSSRPLYFTESNGRIFFAATSDEAGFEPWIGGFAPVADFVTNEIVFEGDAVVLASRSASQSEIVTFEWDFDYDGTVFDVDATGDLSSFPAIDGPSNRTVALRVTNEIGFSDVATKTISILNTAPKIQGIRDTSTLLGSPVMLSATVTDLGVNDTFSLQWDLGDGTIVNDLTEVTHTYGAEGEYFASLTATDGDGAVTVKEFRVVVGPPVTVTTSVSELAEGAALTLTAELSEPLAEDVVVPLAYSGRAIAGADFAESGFGSPPSTVVIPAGQLTGHVLIEIIDDLLDEDNEELVIHVGVPSNTSLATNEPIVISLLDNDSEPTIYISSEPQLLDETTGSVPVAISLSEPSGRDIVFRLATSGSATNESDYTLSDSLLVIPAGETAVETTLSIVDDNLGENAEQIIVEISSAQNAKVIGSEAYPQDILHVIGANDAPTIEFLSTFKRVSETVGAYSIDVVLSNPSQDDVSFDYSVLGSAVEGSDFDLLSPGPTLSIAAGELSHAINFHIIDNASPDSHRYFTARLLSATNALLGPTRYRSTQIVDDESLEIRLSVSDSSIWEDDAHFSVTASLNSPAPNAFVVPFDLDGKAIEGTHYFASNTVFEFAEGDLSATVTFVLAPDDAIRESNRTMKLTLEEPVEASLRDSEIEVTIKDNDPWVATTPFRYGLYPVYFRGADRSSINESDREETFTVYLSQPSNHDITVPVEYTLVTADINDFSRAVSSITIPAGRASGKAEIAIIDDTRDEAAESFRVAIGEPSGANKYSDAPAYSQRTVTIYDNDAPPNPYWIFPETIVREGDTPVVAVGIRLAGISDTSVTARITTGGTATRGQDYELETDRVTFNAGERESVILVGIGDDGDYEALETIDLHVDTGGGRVSTFTINLNDNDSQPRSNDDNRPWWQKLGDKAQDVGNSISDGLKSIRDGVVNLPNDICAVVINPFEPNRPLNSCGSAHDGYFNGATVFVDYNFNETVDFVDLNNDGAASEGDLIEVTTLSAYDGSFTASVSTLSDRNGDGRVDETEAQMVSYGGTDVSTGFDSRIPLTAPLGYPTISPLTTLVAKQRLETGDPIELVEQRVAYALSLPSINYLAADLIAVANQDDLFAANAFAKSVQIFSTVQQIASYVSSLPSGPSLRLAGSLAFADLASKIREDDSILDLTQPFLVESAVQGTLIRAGMSEVSPQTAADVASIIMGSNLAIAEASGATGREWLEAVVQVQSVSTTAVAAGLGELASGQTTVADLTNQFTGANLQGLADDQIIGNVVAPYLVADDVSIVEGDAGESFAVFQVGLSDASNLPVTVHFSTSDFTAIAGEDYLASAGQLTWEPGDTSLREVQVTILGDTLAESDERFHVVLSDAVNAQVLETISFGDILSDDAPAVTLSDSSTDHALLLDISGSGTRLFDNGEVAFDAAYTGDETVAIQAATDVQTDMIAVVHPDASVPTGGLQFIGTGATSSLTIDPSFSSAIEHVQLTTSSGWFQIDGVMLDYENVAVVDSPASPDIFGLPNADVAYGQSFTLTGLPPALFDPALATTETWTVYLDGVEQETIDGNVLDYSVNAVGTYRLTYTALQEGRIPAVGSFEFAVTNAPPIVVDDSFTANEDTELFESSGSGLLANDSDSTAGPIVVSSVEGRSILTDQSFEFASASLDASIPYLATSINDTNYYGVRFEVTETVEIDRVGGNFQFITGTGPFAAIVQLDGPSDFPDSENLTTPDVLATTLVPLAYQQDGDRRGDIDVTLEPGWYAVMFGTGAFGSTGITNLLLNNVPNGNQTFIHSQPTVPRFLTPTAFSGVPNARFVIEGTTSSDAPITLDSGAIVTVASDGSFTYDPNGQFESLVPGSTATDSFTYTVTDSVGLGAEGAVTITIEGVNDAPIAINDSYVVSEESLMSPAPSVGVLVNDSDVDGSILTVTQIDGQDFNGVIRLTSGATVEPAAEPNRFIYDPRTVFNYLTTGQTATDSFTYQVTDEFGATGTATVNITINGWDDAPVVNDDSYTVSEDLVAASSVASGFLANDSDPEGTPLTLAEVDGRLFNAKLTLDSGATIEPGTLPNSFVYDPRSAFDHLIAGQTASDQFTYTVADATGNQSTATVSFTINGVDDPAVISGQSQISAGEDVDIVAGQLNIVDPDLDQAFFVPQTRVLGSYGTFSVDENGAWSYDLDNVLTNSLDEGDSPIDSFTVQSLDGSAMQTIEITIIGGADADTDGVDEAIEDAIGDGNADGVPDSEQDNVASLPNAVTSTTVTLAAASGSTLINVIASDPQLLDEPPPADVQLPIGLLQFTVLVDQGAAAEVRLYYDASEPVNAIYKYGPIGGGDSGYYLFEEIDFGIDEFGNSFVELHLVDGGAGDADGQANGQIVDPVGLALVPGMGNDFVTTSEDQPLAINPTANDVLSNPITIDSVGEAAHGTTAINVDGTVAYQPNENFFGNDAFTYSVTDAAGFVGSATVFVTVLPVNDAPTIQISTENATKSEGQQASATGLFGDIDPGELLELSASIGDIHDNGDGTWSWFYTPTDGPDESQAVVVGVTDGDVLSTTEFPLVVNNVPVAFEAGEEAALIPADEGVFVRTGIAFTDPGTDEWTGTVDYGDGTGEQALTVDSDGKTFDLSHTYTSEGTFTVTVRLKDDDSDFVTDSFAVSVILNQPPVANNDTLAVNEDDGPVDLTGVLGDAEFGLLGNDSDPDGDDVVIIAIDASQISRGSIQLVDGRVVFDPNGEFEALAFGESDSQELVYTIADPNGETSSATAAIVVEGVNDGPTISVDDATVTVDEGQTAENVGSFGNVDGSDTLILSASEGVVWDTGDGRWAWSWDTQDGPVDSQLVTITVADDFVSSSVSFQLNVTNVAPTAVIDSISQARVEGTEIAVVGVSQDPAAEADQLQYAFQVWKHVQETQLGNNLIVNGDFEQTPPLTWMGQNGQGYEVFADIPGWTSSSMPGFLVRTARGFRPIDSLDRAQELIDGRWSYARNTSLQPAINFVDTGDNGRFPADLAFPLNSSWDDNDFAVAASGLVQIPQDGDWTFGTNSDDGIRLTIGGVDVIVDDRQHAPEDHFGTIQLAAGWHEVELLYFERRGGATVELFAAEGSFHQWDPSFRLLGDVDNGGLQVVTPSSVEIQEGDHGTGVADENQVAELDLPDGIDNASARTLRQTVSLPADGIYRLSLDVAKRNSDDAANGVEVWASGQLLGVIQPNQNHLETHAFQTTLPAGDHVIELIGLSNSNLGSVVDNVRLQRVIEWNDWVLFAEQPAGESSEFRFTPDNDGDYRIELTVRDKDGGVTSTNEIITVANALPSVLSLTSSHPDLDHRSDDGLVTIAGEFDDPGSLDSHVVTIDWGDGTVSELSSSEITNRQFAATHTYDSGGVFDISVRIADDGGDVVEQQTSAVVTGMGLVGNTLFFVGTEGRDFISVRESGGNSRVQWNVAGSAARVDHVPTDAIDRMEFYTFDGNDHIQIRDHQGRAVYIDAGDGHNQISTEGSLDTLFAGSGNDVIDTGDGNDVVFAGAGDDRVNSGRGNDIVSGLAGDDRIWGGDGHDLLLGGDGRDRIYGDDSDDLLLADYVENELHALALEQALIEWAVNDDIAAALAELGATSDDDDADRLYGNRGDDALFGGDGDRLRD